MLVQETRGDVVESRHRGHIVEVDQAGAILRVVGDAEHPVTLRSLATPFALVALIEETATMGLVDHRAHFVHRDDTRCAAR